MSGMSQKDVWLGHKNSLRKWAICEHNHERGTIHLRTYVNKRYKITLYMGMDDGDLYDMENDPNELRNLWYLDEYSEIKQKMLIEFLQAEMEREPKFMPRVAVA